MFVWFVCLWEKLMSGSPSWCLLTLWDYLNIINEVRDTNISPCAPLNSFPLIDGKATRTWHATRPLPCSPPDVLKICALSCEKNTPSACWKAEFNPCLLLKSLLYSCLDLPRHLSKVCWIFAFVFRVAFVHGFTCSLCAFHRSLSLFVDHCLIELNVCLICPSSRHKYKMSLLCCGRMAYPFSLTKILTVDASLEICKSKFSYRTALFSHPQLLECLKSSLWCY